jgi:hypothetical protein
MASIHKKVAVVSAGTALSLGLMEVGREARAATFTFQPTITFEVIDAEFSGSNFDGLGDELFPGNFDTVVKGTIGEAAEFAEINIRSLSVPPSTVISNAVFQAQIFTFETSGLGVGSENPGTLGIFGYVGNGIAEASDFEAGRLLNTIDISSASAGDILTFDVTAFTQQLVSNGDSFAGFGIRALNLGALTLGGANFPGISPTLTIETAAAPEPVPEPASVLGILAVAVLAGVSRRSVS